MKLELPPGVQADDIAQDVAEMIAREDELDLETAEEQEARERREEATSLLAFLNSVNEPEAEICVALLMEGWTEKDSVFSYEVGEYETICFLDYVITSENWHFECQENRSSWSAFNGLRDGIRIAKVMERDGL